MSDAGYEYKRCEEHTRTLATLAEHARGVNGQIKGIQADLHDMRKTLDDVKSRQSVWGGGLAILVILLPFVTRLFGI